MGGAADWWEHVKSWTKARLGNPKGGPNPESLVKEDLGLPKNAHVMAFGHFTTDRRLDLVVLDESKTSVQVYLWDAATSRYKASSGMRVSVGGDEEIMNVVPSDFDHDGYLDLLIISGSRNKEEFSLTGYKNNIFLGTGTSLNPSGWVLPNSHDQLTPLDYQGFMQVDLLGSLGKGTGKLEVLASNADGRDSFSSGYKRLSFEPSLQCGAVSWSAYADVDGDGRADLVLLCDETKLFVLLATETGYRVDVQAALPKGASQLTIADVDGDGSPDLLFTTCADGSCALHILYNGQAPFCSGSASDPSGCRSNAVHFSNDGRGPGFALDSDRHQTIPLGEILKGKALLRVDPVNGLPVPLSLGDYDLDGFPDLLLVAADSPDSIKHAHAVLLRNVPCDGGSRAGCKSSKTSRRTFADVFESVGALSTELGVVQAAFADIKGKGSLAILTNGYTSSGESRQKLTAFTNDAFNDVFFVRAESLNGVCPAPCSRKATGSKAAQPYGVNYSGAAFRLSFTDIDGSVRVRSGSQLAQTGNRALQLPFAIFGLGRTNSFVDRFSAGSTLRPSSESPSSHSQAHIIPNSDLIVIPPHADSPAAWTVQIHIHPAAHFMWVAVALVTALTILASCTAFFKIKERREDEAEKRKRAHAINFDAM